MKIVICVHSLTGGGAERVASLWITGFYNRGYDVSAILVDKNSPITYKIPSKVPVYYIGSRFKNKYISFLHNKIFFDSKLKRIIKRLNPDVAIGVMYNWGEKLLKYKQLFGYKVVHTEHNSFERPDYAPMSKVDAYLKFEVNKFVDAVTVLTKADKDFIGDKLKNVFVLPNPLAIIPAKEVPPKNKTVLAVGRLDAWYVKGFDTLINAWANVYKESPEWKLRIVGHSTTGEGLAYLKKICLFKGLNDCVEFVDFQENISDYYGDSEIFVLSSRYEGFGMVLIEAMSQGCACIACDYKGRQNEIIRNRHEGVLCQPNDIIGLTESLQFLIKEENTRKEIQKNSIIRSEDYNLDRIMDKWELILKVLN